MTDHSSVPPTVPPTTRHRASGVLLHPTSLPGPYGIGELGPQARAWVDWLAQAGQSYWQVLPLGPTGYGDSPYQTLGAFAGNGYLVSLDDLRDWGLLTADDLADLPPVGRHDRVDYGLQFGWRGEKLWQAYRRFQAGAAPDLQGEFAAFKQAQASWLHDYTLFRALKEAYGGQPWFEWPLPLRRRDAAALAEARVTHAEAADHIAFTQFLFERQWQALRRYAAARGVQVIGDLPIFVALDSSDAWATQHLFAFDEQGRPEVQAGVPPDYFSATGQLWGNPLYRWDAMQAEGFEWWIHRFARSHELYDLIRVDHFRGFAAYWEVPYPAENAMGGHWVPAPGAEMLSAVRAQLGKLPIIAEDLGVITPDVEELRDGFGLPGMAVLQFAFADQPFEHSPFLPQNVPSNRVMYTGTHDNDTTLGWWQQASEYEQDNFRRYTSSDPAPSDVPWMLTELAWHSPAALALAPVQDLLALDGSARMNQPGDSEGNWQWRLAPHALTPELAARLRRLTEAAGRLQTPGTAPVHTPA